MLIFLLLSVAVASLSVFKSFDLADFKGNQTLVSILNVSVDDLLIQERTWNGLFLLKGTLKVNGILTNHYCALHWKNGLASLAYTQGFSVPILNFNPSISSKEAVEKASKVYNMTIHHDTLGERILERDGGWIHAHEFEMTSIGQAYLVQVDSASGEIHLVDLVKRLTFKALPLPNKDPRDGFSTVVNPYFLPSSPIEWNNDGDTVYKSTRGNNVNVLLQNSLNVDAGSNGFVADWDPRYEPSIPVNARSSVYNVFFIVNVVHDILYQFGFDESAGNYQENNFNKGGLGFDSILVSVQDLGGVSNTSWINAVDGRRPTMTLYNYQSTTPKRDPGLENDILIHELGHGLADRLTGGSTVQGCLVDTEASMMAEGWADALAMFLTRKATDVPETPFVIGAYVTNDPYGLRTAPYTTDMKLNPLLYSWYAKITGKVNFIHMGGEIWATMLNEVYFGLVTKFGYSENWYDATQPHGNIVALQLMVLGMSLQPW